MCHKSCLHLLRSRQHNHKDVHLPDSTGAISHAGTSKFSLSGVEGEEGRWFGGREEVFLGRGMGEWGEDHAWKEEGLADASNIIS